MTWEPMWMIVCFETAADFPWYSDLRNQFRPKRCYMDKDLAERDIMELKADNPHLEFYLMEATHQTIIRGGVVFLEKIGEV